MGTFLGGPHNKDYSILGSILGSPYFGKLPNTVVFLGVRVATTLLTRNPKPKSMHQAAALSIQDGAGFQQEMHRRNSTVSGMFDQIVCLAVAWGLEFRV